MTGCRSRRSTSTACRTGCSPPGWPTSTRSAPAAAASAPTPTWAGCSGCPRPRSTSSTPTSAPALRHRLPGAVRVSANRQTYLTDIPLLGPGAAGDRGDARGRRAVRARPPRRLRAADPSRSWAPSPAIRLTVQGVSILSGPSIRIADREAVACQARDGTRPDEQPLRRRGEAGDVAVQAGDQHGALQGAQDDGRGARWRRRSEGSRRHNPARERRSARRCCS